MHPHGINLLLLPPSLLPLLPLLLWFSFWWFIFFWVPVRFLLVVLATLGLNQRFWPPCALLRHFKSLQVSWEGHIAQLMWTRRLKMPDFTCTRLSFWSSHFFVSFRRGLCDVTAGCTPQRPPAACGPCRSRARPHVLRTSRATFSVPRLCSCHAKPGSSQLLIAAHGPRSAFCHSRLAEGWGRWGWASSIPMMPKYQVVVHGV